MVHNALAEECEERLAEAQDENLAVIDAQCEGAETMQTARTQVERSLAQFSTVMSRRVPHGPSDRIGGVLRTSFLIPGCDGHEGRGQSQPLPHSV